MCHGDEISLKSSENSKFILCRQTERFMSSSCVSCVSCLRQIYPSERVYVSVNV